MGEEIQTSGNSSWSAAGGLEEVEKKGLPTLPLPPKVGEKERSKGNRPYAPPKRDLVHIMCFWAGNLYVGTVDDAKLEQVPPPSDTPHRRKPIFSTVCDGQSLKFPSLNGEVCV